jgi:hypothetical protein
LKQLRKIKAESNGLKKEKNRARGRGRALYSDELRSIGVQVIPEDGKG